MKRITTIVAALSLCATLFAQETITNRYAMKLQQNEDGTYSLLSPKKYRIDLSGAEGLLEPYTPENYVSSKLYKECETVDVVYKNSRGYELTLSIDKAVSESPAPVMFYCHGGGWARGDRSSRKNMSQYLAVQKGIAGVRIQYSLYGKDPDVTVDVAVQDVLDAVAFIKKHASEYNIDPSKVGFCGSSAGGHLAAVAAMKTKGAVCFVGYAGVYDITKAGLIQRTKDQGRKDYFLGLDNARLHKYNAIDLIPKKRIPACLLFCGTGDSVVEYEQSIEFGEAIRNKGGQAENAVYEYYDHNLADKASDKAGEIFFRSVEFIAAQFGK